MKPSLALELELCKRRIEVIEGGTKKLAGDFDDYTSDDLKKVEEWLNEYPDVNTTVAFIESLKDAIDCDAKPRKRREQVSE